ncbi:hypothetical protein HJB79_31535 [Rhizobium lentis]|uniref:WD40/YVTN/BNR-like repeat-containing protein n=1 Tax=Rhizobium lentis TaxID=1138194 RepID=UPI001C833AE8|nr:hypothetical protein [Rhizobium lentis]MBX5143243.1 hypothetical protein [Rhizobium lentis]
MQIFGQGPVPLPGPVSVTIGGLSAGATRLDTVTANGVSAGDRISTSLPASQGTNSLILIGAEPTGPNAMQVRTANYSAAQQSYGTRSFNAVIMDSQHLRQTFALSDYMGSDTFLAGVDSETASGKIYKTVNSFGSSYPVYAPAAKAVRQFLSLNASKQAQLAVCSDPGIVIKTMDGGESWVNIGRLGFEDVLFCAEQEGGPAANVGNILIGTGSGTLWFSSDNGNTWTSKGIAYSGYDQVWGLVYLSGSGASAEYLALLNDDTGTNAPAIIKVSNYGATKTLVTTIGVAGKDHQGFIKLASGALLCGLSDGNVYRLESPYTAATSFCISAIAPSETKPRVFVQWSDGTILMGGQNSGYLWVSEDDGVNFARQHRVGYGDAVISMKGVSSEMVVIGCGQGLLTGKPYKPSIHRAIRCQFDDL